MTEQAAKLTVKVKLHAAQPVVVPTKAPPARLSKLKVTLGLLVLIISTIGGYVLWQQLSAEFSPAVTAESTADTEDHAVDGAVDSVAEDEGATDGETLGATESPDEGGAQSLAERSDQGLISAATEDASHVNATTQPTGTSNSAITETTSSQNQPRAAAQTSESETQAIRHSDTMQSEQPQTATAANINNAIPATAAPRVGRTLPEGFSRIVLSATMERLEPGEVIDALVAQQQIQRLYLFTELKGYAGQQLIHRWSYAGEVKTEALLTIEDSPWRTYSENWLLPDQLGQWRVEIIDQQQKVLYQHDFQYH